VARREEAEEVEEEEEEVDRGIIGDGALARRGIFILTPLSSCAWTIMIILLFLLGDRIRVLPEQL